MSLLPHVRPGRRITGLSAILLPFAANDAIDWDGFAAHVARTAEAGLVPAVNMDTGFVNLLTPPERLDVLRRTRDTLANQPVANGRDRFVAGAFVADQPGDRFQLAAYRREIDFIREHGGTPVIFQSFGLTGQDATAIVASYAAIAKHCPRFIGFELGQMFAPFGQFTFRDPVPAYKHSAAQFLKLRGWISSDQPHPRAAHRPDSDVPVLADILRRLQQLA